MACMIVTDRDYDMGKYKLHKLKDIEELVAQAVESTWTLRFHLTAE